MSVFRSAWALLALLSGLLCGAAAHADEFLDPDVAFQLSVRTLPDKQVELSYRITPGYYLYRERFKFVPAGATLGAARIPPGKTHYDAALEQNVEVYHDQVVVTLPVSAAAKAFTIAATNQGCADKGLCYPPQLRTVKVTLKAFGAAADTASVVTDGAATTGAGAAVVAPATSPAAGPMSVAPAAPGEAGDLRHSVLGAAEAAPAVDKPASAGTPDALRSQLAAPATSPASAPLPAPAPAARLSIFPPRAPASTDAATAQAAPPSADAATPADDKTLATALRSGGLLLVIPLAFFLGLLLSFTPCVLPMLPILSAIIVGQGESVTRRRGLALATSYALGMALVYTALGVAAGLIGAGLAAYLQNPWVLLSFGALLIVLALSMFDVYELQLPAFMRDRLGAAHASLSGGQVGGVFAMGALSALIVSPCVSAPLGGVLLYIAESHDAIVGGVALFALAMGMSVPLLALGASAGQLLPRSGPWMVRIKHLFGFLLIAVALWIMGPALAPVVAMAAWGVLLVVWASTMGAFDTLAPGRGMMRAHIAKGIGLILALLGALQFVGLALGGRDPAAPLARAAVGLGLSQAAVGGGFDGPHFERVASLADLERRLQAAGRPVLLDFYADWCVSCKEMESQTFLDPGVRARLAQAVLLRADVTANTDADRALLKRFHLFGPPGLIFFDAQGRELEAARVVGFQDAPRFTRSLAAAGL